MNAEVRVSRRIAASADQIFAVLADPCRHPELDGSGMLRGAVTQHPITMVGDVFVMRMYYAEHGDYEMDNHVVEFVAGRRIGWEPRPGRGHPDHGVAAAVDWNHRWSYHLAPAGPAETLVTEIYDCTHVPAADRNAMADGRAWLPAMTETLRRLDLRTRALYGS